MTSRRTLRRDGVAFLALAVPVAAGLLYMWWAGAPHLYLATNAGALVLAAVLALALPDIIGIRWRRALGIAAIASLFLAPAIGPEINGIARWLPLGPVQLHSGMLLIPAISVLAAEDDEFAAPFLLIALLAVHLQPDAASGLALCFAAIGRYDAVRDWRMGPVAAVAFVATLEMGMRGELPAQPFVERVLVSATLTAPLVGLALLAALLGGFFLLLKAVSGARAPRHALAGSLFGFATVALLSNYPTPLIGYGAAPIIGYGVALALLRATAVPRSAGDQTLSG